MYVCTHGYITYTRTYVCMRAHIHISVFEHNTFINFHHYIMTGLEKFLHIMELDDSPVCDTGNEIENKMENGK